MEKSSILTELETQCPALLQESITSESNGRKIGHIRADYDGCRWWNTIWPGNSQLATPPVTQEIDWVYDQLVSSNAFRDLAAMTAFCRKHPEAAVGGSKDEYNFYYEGKHCIYWLRCITRRGDYNLYLHAFTKRKIRAEENGKN